MAPSFLVVETQILEKRNGNPIQDKKTFDVWNDPSKVVNDYYITVYAIWQWKMTIWTEDLGEQRVFEQKNEYMSYWLEV